ncbi:MFS transporter [Enterovirga rhinocerotis]|uniref:UMF1 family MFS transporter n=1 Tax=Enterovirga rhinocerotis TaxID=1339210 RepID=A0A4R7C8H5_9HYPH|nr:MFS transporter [Enterovirga rhinocerotis]TDR94930.1 UMF1 family MFS transporter [Enterovirga rhinocerotis]
MHEARSAVRPVAVGRAGIWSWLLFDWACQPFFTLVTTFVFAPYFVSALAANPVQGQALWGYATAAAGLVLAALSPILGSAADASGARKPWIAASCLILAVSSAALWYAAPSSAMAVPIALIAFAVATIAAEVAAVFNNAMMARLAGPQAMGRLSGTGWAMGYAGGLVSLALILTLIVANPETGRTLLGTQPLFGLDPAAREGDRAVGPFSALWLLLFVWPLFVFTPDAPPSGLPFRQAMRDGLVRLRETIADARRQPWLVRFLVANLLYQDALVALFAFGGIYGAGVFGWRETELGLFGILLTVTGTAGAVIGGRLDDRYGARPVILGSLAVLAFVCLSVATLGEGRAFFVDTGPGGPGLFGSVPEKVFVGLGLLIGAVAGPLQASSRSLLARGVPEAEAGRYFGLLAMSGKATSFLAPLLVATATQISGTLAAGPLILVGFFGLAGAMMLGVRRS